VYKAREKKFIKKSAFKDSLKKYIYPHESHTLYTFFIMSGFSTWLSGFHVKIWDIIPIKLTSRILQAQIRSEKDYIYIYRERERERERERDGSQEMRN